MPIVRCNFNLRIFQRRVWWIAWGVNVCNFIRAVDECRSSEPQDFPQIFGMKNDGTFDMEIRRNCLTDEKIEKSRKVINLKYYTAPKESRCNLLLREIIALTSLFIFFYRVHSSSVAKINFEKQRMTTDGWELPRVF